jgi:ABC-type multidrug transport system fused ATPase/permease subunit
MILRYSRIAFAGLMLSAFIVTTFPLITQFFIIDLFKGNLDDLMVFTLLFLVLFGIKFAIDLYVQSYNLKFRYKLEKTIKERIYEKHKSNLSDFLEKKSKVISTYIGLYLLHHKTKLENLRDIGTILFAMILITIFNKTLFFYTLFAIPVLFLFWLFVKRTLFNRSEHGATEDFAIVLHKASRLDEKSSRKLVYAHLETNLAKKIHGRKQLIPIHVGTEFFISAYRILFLAYFGYYVITSYYDITGLIVGLLYITILLRPSLRLIESANIPEITKQAREEIHELT